MVNCNYSWIIPLFWTMNFGYCFVFQKIIGGGSGVTYRDRGPPPGPSLLTRLNTLQNSDTNQKGSKTTLEYTRNLDLEAESSDQEVDINAFSTEFQREFDQVPNPNQKSRPDDLKSEALGVKRLPQALIIGAKKGGTRALLEFLRQHPDVRAPGPEIHFFDRHYDLGLEWYRQQMPATLPGQLTMEKTPCYFVTKEAPKRIFNMDKNVKLILVVRDPVTRAISDYTQSLSKRTAKKPFAQLALLRNSTVVDGHWGAIRIGMYAVHLERWLRYFPMDRIHVVSGEKLITEPARIMAGVQGFLGIKNIITEKHFFFNETKGFPCLKKGEASSRPHCLGKTKGRQHPYIDPRVIVRLRQFFRPFNKKFEQLTGMKFGWT